MRMCGQYARGRGAERWAQEEQRERERELVSVADARVRVVEVADRANQREADERTAAENRRRHDENRKRHERNMDRILGRSR